MPWYLLNNSALQIFYNDADAKKCKGSNSCKKQLELNMKNVKIVL